MTKKDGSGSISHRHGSADPIRIHTKMSWIRTATLYTIFTLLLLLVDNLLLPLRDVWDSAGLGVAPPVGLLARPALLDGAQLLACRLHVARHVLVPGNSGYLKAAELNYQK